MMGEPKPMASLSSGLLARKGQAKPAMRPQGFGSMISPSHAALDDLGWNDMGHEPRRVEPGASPVPAPVQLVEANGTDHADIVPPVVRQQSGLAAAIGAQLEEARDDEGKPLPNVAIRRAHQAVKGRKEKAAFTLRVDHDRHLKLRLACAVSRRSAQQIVTEALDMFLDSVPGLNELALSAPARGKR